MLVTFKTNASHPDVTMFGEAARSLLKKMGQSGNVPGALMPEDIPEALSRLERELADEDEEETPASGESASGAGTVSADGAGGHPDDDDDQVESVSLSRRATPLIGLLETARDADSSVSWSE